MKQKVIYALVIDRSGSMADLRDEIFQSINARIASIKALATEGDKETFVEIVTFNHSVKRVLPLAEASALAPLRESDYQIDGCTALYDAVGGTLERLNLLFRQEVRMGTAKIVIVVYTDGYENASRNYSKADIYAMLKQANSMENVEITLVGCDEATVMMAHEMNFKAENVVRTSKGTMSKSMDVLDNYFTAHYRDQKPNFKSGFKDFDLDK